MKLGFDVRTIGLAALLLGTTMGHGDGCCHSEEVLGPPTGATCPPTSTLTYQSFGQQFMTDYCVECHDSAKMGSDRNGATIDHDFDTLLGIQSVSNHIDQAAGAGPDAVNDQMPPEDEPQPSLEERQMLAEWIACGAP
ncbi:MAG TPA: hypothetical protein VM513_06450 [Kofleriaceae bacterium]|nr:hypothetical protein [Kofleriaceae bacterium]